MRLLARSLAFWRLSPSLRSRSPRKTLAILRDSETEELFQDLVDPLVEAAGMPKDSVDVVIVNDDVNASPRRARSSTSIRA